MLYNKNDDVRLPDPSGGLIGLYDEEHVCHPKEHYMTSEHEYLSLEATRKRYQKKQEENMFRAEMRQPDDKDHVGYDYRGNELKPPEVKDIEEYTKMLDEIGKVERASLEKQRIETLKEKSLKEYEVKEVKGEATVEYPTGGMSSKLDVDYSLMPNVEFVEDVIEVLTLGCTEHGGKYPRDNWKKLPVMDNSTHALQHVLQLHGKLKLLVEDGEGNTEELMTELTHAVCRLWFLHYQILNVNPDYSPKPPLGQRRRLTSTVNNNYTLGE